MKRPNDIQAFLNALGVVMLVVGILGGVAVFLLLGGTPWEAPEIRFAVAIGVGLECLIVAAVLLGMAEGLRLLEWIANEGGG